MSTGLMSVDDGKGLLKKPLVSTGGESTSTTGFFTMSADRKEF